MPKATITAVVNQKGGTAKTTTSENLCFGLAREGKRVLLVDTNPQASLTIALGNPQPDNLEITLTDLMKKVINEEPIAPGEGILHHPEGVDLVPSNIELSGMEVSLVNTMNREKILRQYLDTVKNQYDFILIDCMPSLGMLTINALAAAENALIPVQAQYLSAKGLEQLLGLTWDCVEISDEAIAEGKAYIQVNKELQRVSRDTLKKLDSKDVMLVFPPMSSRTTTVQVLKAPKT